MLFLCNTKPSPTALCFWCSDWYSTQEIETFWDIRLRTLSLNVNSEKQTIQRKRCCRAPPKYEKGNIQREERLTHKKIKQKGKKVEKIKKETEFTNSFTFPYTYVISTGEFTSS